LWGEKEQEARAAIFAVSRTKKGTDAQPIPLITRSRNGQKGDNFGTFTVL